MPKTASLLVSKYRLPGSITMSFKPAIAQLVEHLTVEKAAIRWSLVRFRVAGFLTWLIVTLSYLHPDNITFIASIAQLVRA